MKINFFFSVFLTAVWANFSHGAGFDENGSEAQNVHKLASPTMPSVEIFESNMGVPLPIKPPSDSSVSVEETVESLIDRLSKSNLVRILKNPKALERFIRSLSDEDQRAIFKSCASADDVNRKAKMAQKMIEFIKQKKKEKGGVARDPREGEAEKNVVLLILRSEKDLVKEISKVIPVMQRESSWTIEKIEGVLKDWTKAAGHPEGACEVVAQIKELRVRYTEDRFFELYNKKVSPYANDGEEELFWGDVLNPLAQHYSFDGRIRILEQGSEFLESASEKTPISKLWAEFREAEAFNQYPVVAVER